MAHALTLIGLKQPNFDERRRRLLIVVIRASMASDMSRSGFMEQPIARGETEDDQKTIRGIPFPPIVQNHRDLQPATEAPVILQIGQPLLGQPILLRIKALVWPLQMSRWPSTARCRGCTSVGHWPWACQGDKAMPTSHQRVDPV
ncbi:MAG: hypothetical protein VYB46_10055 [Pseudomonadota bacterium]|nr:hypothetical protein [Pseudomonadota bacterium]